LHVKSRRDGIIVEFALGIKNPGGVTDQIAYSPAKSRRDVIVVEFALADKNPGG
jgi:hypothetical protein